MPKGGDWVLEGTGDWGLGKSYSSPASPASSSLWVDIQPSTRQQV
ncbi:hypothetical protein [Anabaena sp. 4-3]|nr:hypothetical protein [Anabaena sp. 4-3]